VSLLNSRLATARADLNFVAVIFVFIVVPLFGRLFVFAFTEVLQEIRRDITPKVVYIRRRGLHGWQ
jgi:hypothetical protein